MGWENADDWELGSRQQDPAFDMRYGTPQSLLRGPDQFCSFSPKHSPERPDLTGSVCSRPHVSYPDNKPAQSAERSIYVCPR